MEIYALHSVRDASKHLVRDSVEGIGKGGDRQMLAKDFHLIAFTTGDISNIDHGHIHTDIAHILGLLTIDKAVAMPIAKMAIQTISIAYGDGRNHGVALNLTLTAIAHSLTSRYMAHLEDGGLKCRDSMKDVIISWIDAIETYAQTAHIHLALWEVLNACRVVHMAQNLMGENTL